MRLLHTATRKLEEFYGANVPLYAILSHRWATEVSLQDLQSPGVEQQAGYEKVRRTCATAASHGFDYVWIDSCCIDKTSSAELSASINSMYRWYQESGVCYAYLADVPGKALAESEWFTRGWTLQELIAPKTVVFFDMDWQEIGTKSSLQKVISTATGIPRDILLGGDLESASIAQRMSWASQRETTVVEDLAYCLIGIFGVNMPMIYGEGERAFIRLQEEVLKVTDDYSIFAWELDGGSNGGLLASTPAAFRWAGDIEPVVSADNPRAGITLSSKGIHLTVRVGEADSNHLYWSNPPMILVLPCKKGGKEDIAIYVRPLSDTNDYFMRVYCWGLADGDRIGMFDDNESQVCVRRDRATNAGKGESSVWKAAACGNERVMQFLLEQGAGLDARDEGGRTPLSLAAAGANEAVVRILLENGADPEKEDKNGRTPLSWAAESRKDSVVPVIRRLLDEGVTLDSHSQRDRRTPLSWASGAGSEAAVKLLIEKGAEIESIDSRGRTPLTWAAKNGHLAAVEMLLDKAAKVDGHTRREDRAKQKKDSGRSKGSSVAEIDSRTGFKLFKIAPNYQSPISCAAENGHAAVVRLLLENGAEVRSKDTSGYSPILYAARNQHEEVVKQLLDAGAPLESANEVDRTPLSLAAEVGSEPIVRLLIRNGANLETQDTEGSTPLFWATRTKRLDVVLALIEAGVSAEARTESGTLLFWALKRGNAAIVNLLLDRGVGVESKLKDPKGGKSSGRTLLWWAATNGNVEVMKALLERGALPPHIERGDVLFRPSKDEHRDALDLLKRYAKERG